MSRTNQTLTQDEAERRAAVHHGYKLVSKYTGYKHYAKGDFYCPVHDFTQNANIKNVFLGMRLQCCHKEHMRAVLSEKMKGDGNNFFGKKHSIETREKISAIRKTTPNHFRGKPRPQHITDAIRRAITGVPRSPETKAKLSAKATARHKNFDYIIRKVRGGKTTGREGIFYILRIGNQLKFGSATTTLHYRMVRMKQKHGDDISVEMHCLVSDAGAYEAAMMQKHREHWSHGEFFNNFRSELPYA